VRLFTDICVAWARFVDAIIAAVCRSVKQRDIRHGRWIGCPFCAQSNMKIYELNNEIAQLRERTLGPQ